MNDQYPASPTPGQPDRRKPQRSAWNGGEKSSGSFGKSGGQSSGNPFSSPESNSGPFSSGGTTSLFHSGLKQMKSAWGTPVPDVQGAASQGQQLVKLAIPWQVDIRGRADTTRMWRPGVLGAIRDSVPDTRT